MEFLFQQNDFLRNKLYENSDFMHGEQLPQPDG